MARSRRTCILVEGDPLLSTLLCEQIAQECRIETITGPREVLVMNKVRENAQASLFYLGEALLTECRVRLASSVTGIGLILGAHRTRAYELAVIDAAFCLPELLQAQTGWLELLEREEVRLAAVCEQTRGVLAATRVEFSRMLTPDERREGVA
jgi:alpha-D-ribose 1-methylphosphonate 5-triphosphate synthase subunit PhnG